MTLHIVLAVIWHYFIDFYNFSASAKLLFVAGADGDGECVIIIIIIIITEISYDICARPESPKTLALYKSYTY